MLKQTRHLTLTICAAALLAISQPAHAQISEFKILPADGAAGHEFGASVSISGEYAVVGAPGNDDNGSSSGSAYVFKRSGTSWAQEAKLLPSDGATEDYFGVSVSISGNDVVVGAVFGNGSGSAYVFKRSGTSWAQEAKLLASDGAVNDRFGGSVSISGDYALVGAHRNDGNGSGSGSAYLYSGIIVGIDDERAGIPVEFALSQNYPNPFNPVSTIRYDLPQATDFSLIVYDILGREVARLVDGYIEPGYHQVVWDGKTASGQNVPTGLYIARLVTPEYTKSIKMVLLK